MFTEFHHIHMRESNWRPQAVEETTPRTDNSFGSFHIQTSTFPEAFVVMHPRLRVTLEALSLFPLLMCKSIIKKRRGNEFK